MEIFLTTVIEERPVISLLLAFCLLALLSCVPFLPIPLVVGLLATQYEWHIAFIVSVAGNVVGSVLMFVLMRRLLAAYAKKQLAKYKYVQRFSQFMRSNGFLAVLVGRMIPIMPSAAINSIASITGVSFMAFCAATFIGKMPNMLIYSVAGSELQNSPLLTLTVVALYIVVLGAIGHAVKKKLSVRTSE